MSSKQDNGGGLSVATLAIASASSLAAAIVVHRFWQAGAFVGAAITPVIVAVVSETLRKPVDAVKSRTTTVNPPPLSVPPERTVHGRRRKLHLGLAVATGLVAFVLAGFLLTGAEAVFGGASGSDRFRVVPGEQKKSDDGARGRDAPAQTQPSDEAPAPAPEETTPEEAPEETVPAPPEETTPAPPAETVPAAPGQTTPDAPAP